MLLINGDCLEVLKKIENNSVDIMVLDLPYGITNCPWDEKIDLHLLWIQLKRIAKERCPIFFFANMLLGVDLINSNRKWFRYDLVWTKNHLSNPFHARSRFNSAHENIFVFYNKAPVYNYLLYHQKNENPQIKKPKNREAKGCFGSPNNCSAESYTPRLPLSYQMFNTIKSKDHNTSKPVHLIEMIIKYYSNEGDTVLDPTMGGGSTGVASMNLNRNFIGIEKDVEIFNSACKRLNCESSCV